MQCTCGYPAEFAELDLRVIATYREKFPDVVIGFSGHDNGIAMPLAAYMLGARIIEKHFTLNRAMRGTDHRFSLEPVGMKKMIRDLQRTPAGARRRPQEGLRERGAARSSRWARSWWRPASCRAGHVLTAADIAIKSPGDGLAPYYLDQLLGQTLTRDLRVDESITLECRSSSHPTAPRQACERPLRARRAASRSSPGRLAISARSGAKACSKPVPRSSASTFRRQRRTRRSPALLATYGESKVRLIAASVTDRAALEAARDQVARVRRRAARAREQRGHRRAAVAIGWRLSLDEIPFELNRRIFEVNTLGLFQVAQIFGTEMVKAGRGSIINIGSLYASVSPDPRFYDHIVSDPPFLKPPAYGASKAADRQSDEVPGHDVGSA